ncbi:MAG: hypothetical protein PVG56_09225 [Anaerolineae bacterium]
MTITQRSFAIADAQTMRQGLEGLRYRMTVDDKPVASEPGEKRILVVSDHETLALALEINLGVLQDVKVSTLILNEARFFFVPGTGDQARFSFAPGNAEEEGHQRWQAARHSDLIVVALASPQCDPLVALSRLGLLDRVGYVPLLTISDGPQRSIPEIQLVHLDFPFKAQPLRKAALQLLGMPAGALKVCG